MSKKFKYKVLEPGFINGSIHSPTGKRRFVVVDKKFKKCPSWLELVDTNTVFEEVEQLASDMTDEQRKMEIDAAVNFLDEKVSPSGPQVKTL